MAPIALPEANQTVPAGTIVTVSGWGNLSVKKKQRILLSFLIRVRNRNLVPRAQVDDEINLPDVLHWVHVPVTSEDFCREAYDGEVIIDSMMCAGVPEGELAIFVSTSERWETLKNGGCL